MPRYKSLPVYTSGRDEITKALISLVQTYRWYLIKNGWQETACLSDLDLLEWIQVRMELVENEKSSFVQGDVMQVLRKEGFFYVRFMMGERRGRPIWTKPYPLGRLWKNIKGLLRVEF